MLKKITSCLLISMFFLNSQASAKEITLLKKDKDIERIGIELGGAFMANVFPSIQTKISYRLPTFDNSLDLFATYNFGINLGGLTQHAIVGTKLYFKNKGIFQPYGFLGIGANFGYAAGRFEPNENNSFIKPQAQLGLGSDFMFNKNFGLSLNLFVLPRIEKMYVEDDPNTYDRNVLVFSHLGMDLNLKVKF